MKINPAIFREYDIRGIAGKDLTEDFARLLGLGFAAYLEKNQKPNGSRFKVSLGWDCRLSSQGYADALTKGLSEGGVDVVRLGTCPTPLTYFSLFHLNTDGGIMITGSHNPSDYNGFKICIGRDTIYGKRIQELRQVIEQNPQGAPQHGKVTEYAIIPPYIEKLLEIAKPVKNKRIVLDSGNGTASIVAPELFSKLGADVVPLYCDMDGRFPNHHPDPTVTTNLKDLIETVKKVKADFGLAFDGDADRIGLVDENGRIVYGDEIMVMFSRDILKETPGATIISEVKSSHRLYNDIAANGGKPIMWKTGHSLIKSKMKETKAALAGEMSGHMFFADRYYGYDDAIYAALRVYEIASNYPKGISEYISDLPQTVSTPEIRIDCEENKKFALVEETKKRLSSGRGITDIDGVRVDFGDGWGLVRASNTQPVLVLRFEATSNQRLKDIRNTIEGALFEAAKAVGHGPLKESSDH